MKKAIGLTIVGTVLAAVAQPKPVLSATVDSSGCPIGAKYVCATFPICSHFDQYGNCDGYIVGKVYSDSLPHPY